MHKLAPFPLSNGCFPVDKYKLKFLTLSPIFKRPNAVYQGNTAVKPVTLCSSSFKLKATNIDTFFKNYRIADLQKWTFFIVNVVYFVLLAVLRLANTIPVHFSVNCQVRQTKALCSRRDICGRVWEHLQCRRCLYRRRS